jgi:hypothetical protein
MKAKLPLGFVGLLAALATAPSSSQASSVKHFDLDQLAVSADRVFRGTVVDVKPGTMTLGGSQLPTTTYRFRVTEVFKGTVAVTKGNTRYAEVTMVGSAKANAPRGKLTHFSIFRDVPRLAVGREYLLFVTQPSRAGLSTTVGLGQGCFDIDTTSSGQLTTNRAGNVGLARGISGAVPYADLASRVRTSLGTKGGRR